jgi:hypothetical protein
VVKWPNIPKSNPTPKIKFKIKYNNNNNNNNNNPNVFSVWIHSVLPTGALAYQGGDQVCIVWVKAA